jgi:outer membrane protein TolC
MAIPHSPAHPAKRTILRTGISTVLCASIFILPAAPQQTSRDRPRGPEMPQSSGMRFTSPYRARPVSSASFANSARTYALIKAGNMYLSLQDAIALALENNLDIQVQRYNPMIAGTELKRAKGGGVLRGLDYNIRELPQGVGGPGGPLLTTLGASASLGQVSAASADLAVINQQQTSLSVQSAIPYSSGSPIPAYDPFLNLAIDANHTSTPQTTSFTTGTYNLLQNQILGDGSYDQGFSTGTHFSLNYIANRYDTGSLRSDYNPYTTGSLGITITQPLLQGFGIDVNRRFIRIAGNEEKIANLVFNQQVITTVSSVIRLYWDLVSLRADVRVKEQALATAQKLYDDNKQQVEVGTLAPLQLKQAAAEVARAKQDLINSQSLVDQQEIVLKNVLTRSGSSDPSLDSVHIVTLDHITVPQSDNLPPVSALVAEALRNRPDLAQAQIEITNAGLSLKGSKNGLLPQLNIVAGATNNALAGSVNPLSPIGSPPGTLRSPDPFLLGGAGAVLSQIFQRNFPDYGIGFQLNIPLRNRVAQADVARDQLQMRQSEVRLKQTENQVSVEVQNAVVTLRRARASYDAAVETRQLQQEALEAEQQRFSVGQSTSFFVIQYERDLAQARSTEVIAMGNYAKAKAALDRALGVTLTSNHVSFAEARTGIVQRLPTAIPLGRRQ